MIKFLLHYPERQSKKWVKEVSNGSVRLPMDVISKIDEIK